MNSEMAYGILDILTTMQEAVKEMLSAYTSGNLRGFESVGKDLSDGLTVVQDVAAQEDRDDACVRLGKTCICAVESLKDILQIAQRKPSEVAWKLECELLMILENMALEFYYRKLVREDPKMLEEFKERLKKTGNYYRLDQPEDEREYVCDLSIKVQAYNHLDINKICVERILQNLPKGISYELILHNHGSDDGTREYFESIEEAHVVNVAMNRAFVDMSMRYVRGKYYLFVSNDVFIGKNAIENMYRAIAGHDDYGWIVPSTSNVSNFQTIPTDYDNFQGFLSFAEKNNQYDEKRHEMRTRLCNPLYMIRTDIVNQYDLEICRHVYSTSTSPSFPDDRLSLWMRRKGYKNILAKDAYCHHIGSVTLKNDFDLEQKWEKFYNAGREEFRRYFGVDPWGTGCYYEKKLFDTWKLPRIDCAVVLGLNCGFGSNSLKVRESLKEMGAKEGTLYNGMQEECWLQDLKGISDEVFLFDSLQEIVGKVGRNYFDFIVIDDTLKNYNSKDYLKELSRAGIKYGQLAFRDEEGNWHIVRGE